MNTYQDFDVLHNLLKDWRIYELFAAAIGSAAGAWFVFKVATYAEIEKQKHRESQDLNKAFSVVFTYTNSAQNFLKLLRPKIEELHKLTEEVVSVNAAPPTKSSLVVVVEFKESFKSIQEIEFLSGSAFASISALRSISGRPNIFAVLLEKSAKSLNMSIAAHNQKLEDLKKLERNDLVVSKLLGLVEDLGSVDEGYRHHLENMQSAANEIIFFGTDILREIATHHKGLKRMFKDRELKVLRLKDNDDVVLQDDSEYLKSWNDFPTIVTQLK
jgi:hypothetical protein